MAKNCHTPIGFFLRLPLRQFIGWIHANNDLVREELEEAKNKKK